MKTNEIFAIGNEVLKTNVRQGATIYKNEIFSELKTDKERKSMRVKLRRQLDNYIITAKQSKGNAEKLSALRDAWKKYSQVVYSDVNIICDANARGEKIADCKEFLAMMQDTTKEKTKQAKAGK